MYSSNKYLQVALFIRVIKIYLHAHGRHDTAINEVAKRGWWLANCMLLPWKKALPILLLILLVLLLCVIIIIIVAQHDHPICWLLCSAQVDTVHTCPAQDEEDTLQRTEGRE